jgi:hypothetical protein
MFLRRIRMPARHHPATRAAKIKALKSKAIQDETVSG